MTLHSSNDRPELKKEFKERLEFPKAVLIQLRNTLLFNSMIDKAIEDINILCEELGD